MAGGSSTLVFALSREEGDALAAVLAAGNYVPKRVPYAVAAADAPSWKANVALYSSGKCVVQGSGSRDFVENVLEPLVLRRVVLAPAQAAGGAEKGAAAAAAAAG
ncbi:MAG: hypothetical protein IJ783_11370, partial [Kiritimatiellae bacterium]|nr:hypothetical protein [Kiritimatiellia bacterium]